MAHAYQLNQNSRLYVIGDIHGRLDLLDQLINAIHRDVGAYGTKSLTVTLGDYIDRGPSSRGVIDRLLTNPFPGNYIALKGNHEALLQAFLDQPETGDYWRQLGGLETLSSFGISAVPPLKDQQYQQAAEALRAALSPAQAKFLTSLKPSLTVGRFFLCHAGVRPGVPLDRQREEDLLWIRDEFLNCDVDFGKIVVHGHTPTTQPNFRPNRINIDTGAFASGRLTCLVVEGETYRTIST
jgi:serine/threonine protein phosphatase 1